MQNMEGKKIYKCERCNGRGETVKVTYGDPRELFNVSDGNQLLTHYDFNLCSDCSLRCTTNADNVYQLIDKRRRENAKL
ncbi:MAG: hypothetical protein M3367_03180 [Acidobacteriota bacterium]|nr:hypothetical protein [Acidobacteriota bacterium]